MLLYISKQKLLTTTIVVRQVYELLTLFTTVSAKILRDNIFNKLFHISLTKQKSQFTDIFDFLFIINYFFIFFCYKNVKIFLCVYLLFYYYMFFILIYKCIYFVY